MNYIVYQTTNTLNGKIYIGRHKLVRTKDYYLGSGSLIKQAIRKYGRENFKFEILFKFKTLKESEDKEAKLVDEEFVARSDTYNLIVGGAGPGGKGKKISESHKDAIRSSKLGVPRSEEVKQKISRTRLKRKIISPNKGKSLSDSHKLALRNARIKPIKIDDIIYPSSKEIAEKYSISTTSVRDRIKSSKWPGWTYYDQNSLTT